jgi:hypothetical protein
MRYYIDTEFSESGPYYPIELISIGIVAEDGREFYAVSTEFLEEDCNDWVRENVLPHLAGIERVSLKEIRKAVIKFIGGDKPSFWGYYSSYDWVLFCQIFGAMVDLPPGYPMHCNDIKQWCEQLDNPKLPKRDSNEHNALYDARWNKIVWDFLDYYEKRSRQ